MPLMRLVAAAQGRVECLEGQGWRGRRGRHLDVLTAVGLGFSEKIVAARHQGQRHDQKAVVHGAGGHRSRGGL